MEENGIIFQVYADGKALAYIDILDVCVLFGNALDNAIEAVLKIPESGKRYIEIKTLRHYDTLLIIVTNTIHTVPDSRENVLLTSKTDAKNHGYGMGNMEKILEKYNGTLHWEVVDNEFELTMMLPQGGKEDESCTA